MKKTFIKTLALSAILLSFSVTSVFAQSSSKKTFSHPQWKDSERGFDFCNSNFQKARHSMPGKMAGGRFGGIFAGQKKMDLLGTVSSIDAENSIITVKDADGKEILVHVSAFTRLIQLDKNAMKNPVKPEKNADEKTSAEKTAGEKPSLPQIPEIKLADLKTGASVMVKKFDVATKTIEAERILTIKE